MAVIVRNTLEWNLVIVENHMDKGQPAMKSPCGLSLLSIGLFMFLAITASEGATLARLRVGYPSPSASFVPRSATNEAGLL